MMKGEHTSHKEVGHWPYLAIVAVVAVVAVVFLVMKGGGISSQQPSEGSSSAVAEEIEVYDEEGNIVGAARWSGSRYRQVSRVVRDGGDGCVSCGNSCSVCGSDRPPSGLEPCCAYCNIGCLGPGASASKASARIASK